MLAIYQFINISDQAQAKSLLLSVQLCLFALFLDCPFLQKECQKGRKILWGKNFLNVGALYLSEKVIWGIREMLERKDYISEYHNRYVSWMWKIWKIKSILLKDGWIQILSQRNATLIQLFLLALPPLPNNKLCAESINHPRELLLRWNNRSGELFN